MATVLKAGNATTGGSFTPDNTGTMQIKTGTGAGTTAITIDASQNVTFAGSATFAGVGGGFSNMQVFTSTGTFTIPAGVTKVKVTVIGGGGGSASTAGAGGGTSSFGAYCSATGGARGVNGTGGTGGTGAGGTLNILGSYATSASAGGSDSFSTDISGGSSIFGNASYGAGAMGSWVNAGGSGVIAGGGAGGTAIEVISGLTPGGTVAVTVGAAGTGSSANGYAGVVIVEY